MELKQLRSFATVVESRSFTKAAEKLYTSQPTISTHIRQLEEQLHSRLIVRTTKSIEVTPRGWELYECAATILKLQDDLLQRWSGESRQIIRLGASTIPSAYLLPELLTAYGKAHPGVYFSIHQSDSRGRVDGLLNCSFDVGLIGMKCTDEALSCIPFYQDRMVLIAPVNEHFLRLKERREIALEELLREPMILREEGSGSKKSADRFLERMGVKEGQLQITARINDQEAVKNLVAQGLGVSIISERAARNFCEEKRVLLFELPEDAARRSLYLISHKSYSLQPYIQKFTEYVKHFYDADGERPAAGA